MKAAVFIQRGCPACDEFLPRIRDMARQKAVPLEVVDIHRRPRAAVEIGIRATPTTIVLTDRGTERRRVGNLPPDALERLFS